MSVAAGLRGEGKEEGKLDAIEKARDLASYTITITANEKVFIPKFQRSITDEINKAATRAFLDARTANDIRVKNQNDFMERRKLQVNAIRSCNELLGLIQLARPVFHLKLKRIEFWGDKTLAVREKLRAWADSDYKRYSEMLKRHF